MNNNKYNKYITLFFMFLFGVRGVFANNTKKIFTNTNFLKYFGQNNIEWFNWVIYFALIIALTFIIKEVGLKNTKIGSRPKALISMLISFMGITGLMWVLIANNRAPSYLAYFVTEIFILVLAGLIVKAGFTKDGEKFSKPLPFRVFVIFLAFMIVNGFHGLILSDAVNLKGFSRTGIDQELILVNIAQTINFQIPFLLYVIIYILTIYFFAGESSEKLDPEEKERRKKVKEYKKLLGLLGKEIKEAEKNFSDLSHMLNTHHGGRR